jgi:ABC-type lipoprotein release transport system permease subunit
MALVGVAIGIGAALGLTGLMRTLLFGVTARDPMTFAAVAALLILVSLLASYIPARRAMLVDPMVALRDE